MGLSGDPKPTCRKLNTGRRGSGFSRLVFRLRTLLWHDLLDLYEALAVFSSESDSVSESENMEGIPKMAPRRALRRLGLGSVSEYASEYVSESVLESESPFVLEFMLDSASCSAVQSTIY